MNPPRLRVKKGGVPERTPPNSQLLSPNPYFSIGAPTMEPYSVHEPS